METKIRTKCVVCHEKGSTGQCFYCKPIDQPIRRNPGYFKTPEEVDKLVCQWSIKFGIAMSTEALNELVDTIFCRYLNDSPPIIAEKGGAK